MSSAVRTLAQQVPKLARSMKTSSKALAEGGHGGYYYVRAFSNVCAFALLGNVRGVLRRITSMGHTCLTSRNFQTRS
jgi:hypothetical protein